MERSSGEGAGAPIGIFDSGIGGLTVLKAIRDRLPAEDLIYIGDLARSPYGTKSKETVRRYARQISRYLLTRGVKLIVIACNTASAAAGEEVREQAGQVPVLELVGHGSRLALDRLAHLPEGEARIGILGTRTTVSSDFYPNRIEALARERAIKSPQIRQKACPLFVPLVEEGLWEGEIPDLVARMYLEEMKAFSPHLVILACTHYPLLQKTIARVLPENTILLDGAPDLARSAASLLDERGLLAPSNRKGSIEFHCSDSGDTFRVQAGRFLDMPVDIVHHIDLESRED